MNENKTNIQEIMKPQFFEITAPVHATCGQWMCAEALSISGYGEVVWTGLTAFFVEVNKNETL